MRLSSKMILFNILSKGLIFLGFLVIGPYVLKYFAIEYTDNRLVEKKETVLRIFEEQGIESFFEEDSSTGYGSYNLLKEEYISLEKGIEEALQDTIFNEERIIDNDVVSYRVLSYVFDQEGGRYLLEIGRSLATINQIEKVLSQFILVCFVLFLLISGLVDGAFNNYILKPLKKIIHHKLPQIKDPNQRSEPIATTTTDFKILDKAIDDMMVRIQHAFKRERQFIAHASHELLTPVSILQSKIENLLGDNTLDEKVEQRLYDALRTMQKLKHIVRSLLFISKIENAQYIKNEVVDLQQITDEIAEEWLPIATEKGLTFEHASMPHLQVEKSNHSLVFMMIQNAVKNAIYYTPDKGKVTLSCFNDKDRCAVEVKDNGNGIDEALLAQVKAGTVFIQDAKSEKSGFGIQIMNKIADYLGVDMSIRTSREGTTITFSFSTIPADAELYPTLKEQKTSA